MSDRYVYPSEKTMITPSAGYHYTSLTDFLTKVRFAEGFHYVTVVAFDRTTLPVPATTTTTTAEQRVPDLVAVVNYNQVQCRLL